MTASARKRAPQHSDTTGSPASRVPEKLALLAEVEAARAALDEVERLADEGAASVDELCRAYLDAVDPDDEDSAVRTLRDLVAAPAVPSARR